MGYISSINNLKQQHFKNCTPGGIKKDGGILFNKMESGEVDILERWVTGLYTLNLQYLTEDQAIDIYNDVRNSMKTDGSIKLDLNKIKIAGYLDVNKSGIDPTFTTDYRLSKPSMVKGTGFYNVSIPLEERVSTHV